MAQYLPIAEHGLIGDLHTVALVGTAANRWIRSSPSDDPAGTRRAGERKSAPCSVIEAL
jgi:hypothetical protein